MIGQPCYTFAEVPSTMDAAHQLAAEGAPEGACVLAETQTSGRGRSARQWVSPQGGIYLSVILRPTRSLTEWPQLALVAGLAVAQAVNETTKLSPSIRWPNDVLLNGKKLAGILTEAKSSGYDPRSTIHDPRSYTVVGIGLNVSAGTGLPDVATALDQHVTPAPDREALTSNLFNWLEQVYDQWNREGFSAVRPGLLRWTGLFGLMVHLTTGQGTFEGQAVDIDEAGRLLVRLDHGIVRAFDAGEVTLLQ